MKLNCLFTTTIIHVGAYTVTLLPGLFYQAEDCYSLFIYILKKQNIIGYTMGLSFKLLNRITVCLWQSMPVALHLCTPSVTKAFTSALLYS